eukprot:NODE_31797_length_389_cov_2.404580.p4 GENE.NODE_31797_length_389_cov_2.404580~~NODE_31797_length_389_cov_2.404580.p4  ORF type:complete len:73 (-),score=21.21 NODE_31797_length_389_cov_2.404580:75-293(-)
MPVFRLTVPAGLGPGNTVTFDAPGGKIFQAVVPPGVVAGQTFEAEVDDVPEFMQPRDVRNNRRKKQKNVCCA